MSDSRNPTVEKSKSLANAYAFTLVYGNAVLLAVHPTERLKVAAQINLQQSTWLSVKPLMFQQFRNLYAGFESCILRQNSKYLYRTLLMTDVPGRVDKVTTQGTVANGLMKSGLVSAIDTFFILPFENIKTIQMKEKKGLSIPKASAQIYRERGLYGFYAGSQMTAAKSFPSWLYLFMAYEATKEKRKKADILTTLTWGAISAVPITVLTTPFDVIKTQQQASLLPKKESALQSAKKLMQNHGMFSLYKGYSLRLAHRSLSIATGYAIMDIYNKK